MFIEALVTQQPSATVDEVIEAWAIEDMSKRCPREVHQRDLFAAALSQTAKAANRLGHQICSWIAPSMMPVLQLTDTDLAFGEDRCKDI